MKEMININILYCGDDKMFRGFLISLLSLLKHSDRPLYVYILTARLRNKKKQFMALTDAHAVVLNQVAQKNNSKNFVRKIDITKLYKKHLPKANHNTMFTPYSMLRLYVDLIPEIPDRILYLDADIVCRRNFDNFYDQDLTDTEFVGVLDHYGKWFFHHRLQKFDYINSGMLLLNVKIIKQTGLMEKCRRLCDHRPMIMPDQSSLNRYAKTKRYADRKYNEQHGVYPNTVFHHFSTNWKLFPVVHTVTVKPWEIDKVHSNLHLHDYDDIYSEYLKLIH